MMVVCGQFLIDDFVEEVEKRNCLKFLFFWLEVKIYDGFEELVIYNVFVKIYIDVNNNLERFLRFVFWYSQIK